MGRTLGRPSAPRSITPWTAVADSEYVDVSGCFRRRWCVVTAMKVRVLDGDLLDQPVDAIVNAWNRNVIPWWVLIPQGVSGAIRRRAGTAPFRELARAGPIPLGHAVVTGAGQLPHRAIIHVAGISLLWVSSERAVRGSVVSAIAAARDYGFRSVAFPLIGAGTGGAKPDAVLAWMTEALQSVAFSGRVVIVRYRHSGRPSF